MSFRDGISNSKKKFWDPRKFITMEELEEHLKDLQQSPRVLLVSPEGKKLIDEALKKYRDRL